MLYATLPLHLVSGSGPYRYSFLQVITYLQPIHYGQELDGLDTQYDVMFNKELQNRMIKDKSQHSRQIVTCNNTIIHGRKAKN